MTPASPPPPHETPIAWTVAAHSLRGTACSPVVTDAPRAAFVLVPPLFEERKAAWRALVETARALATIGVASIRFDLRGCGDSDGDFAAFAAGDWIEDIRAAQAEAARRWPGARAGLLGVRLGATLAATAAARNDGPVLLALWEPFVRAREGFDRELRRHLVQEMMMRGHAHSDRRQLYEALARGETIDVEGYPVTGALVDSLGTLDLLELAPPRRSHVLLLQLAATERPAALLERLHAHLLATRIPAELQCLRALPFWSLIGIADTTPAIEATLRWADTLCREQAAHA